MCFVKVRSCVHRVRGKSSPSRDRATDRNRHCKKTGAILVPRRFFLMELETSLPKHVSAGRPCFFESRRLLLKKHDPDGTRACNPLAGGHWRLRWQPQPRWYPSMDPTSNALGAVSLKVATASEKNTTVLKGSSNGYLTTGSRNESAVGKLIKKAYGGLDHQRRAGRNRHRHVTCFEMTHN